jgi:hypothetical protein
MYQIAPMMMPPRLRGGGETARLTNWRRTRIAVERSCGPAEEAGDLDIAQPHLPGWVFQTGDAVEQHAPA